MCLEGAKVLSKEEEVEEETPNADGMQCLECLFIGIKSWEMICRLVLKKCLIGFGGDGGLVLFFIYIFFSFSSQTRKEENDKMGNCVQTRQGVGRGME